MGGKSTDDAQRMAALKQLIRDLHSGAGFEDVQRRFTALVGAVSPEELARTEQQLISEGLPVEEVKRLCDVHVKVVREALERHVPPSTPPGHPVHTFLAENRAIERRVAGVREILARLASGRGPDARRALALLREELARLRGLEVHYTRKENQLFPLLERHGVSGPSKVMWAHHDDIRAGFKALLARLDGAGPKDADAIASETAQLLEAVESMITKEEKVLLPTALKALSEDEWRQVRSGEDEVGYFEIPPPPAWPAKAAGTPAAAPPAAAAAEGLLPLSTGALTAEQVNLMLTNLPVDVTFVDERDEVRYYSAGKERIFTRTPAIIGRKVQLCHPPASVDRVQRILDDFRAGRRDVAEFWLTLGGRFVHIRYFAVRDNGGAYRGTIEVSQDVTGIRNLKGERRLLDDTGKT